MPKYSGYDKYSYRPIDHAVSTQTNKLFTPPNVSPWALNGRVFRKSFRKRWGYAQDRNFGSGVPVYVIAIYQEKDGTRNTMYITDEDLCLKETSSGKTFSYKTETYATGNVTDIVGAVVTGSGTSWSAASNIAPGDKFILDTDHSTDVEPDTNWGTIQTVDSTTQITLTANYSGTTGTGMTESYKGRMVYSVPALSYPWYEVINNKFIFGSGNIDVMSWPGTGYAAALDATYAKKARYGIEFADRLVLADLELSSTREPQTVQWSKQGDETDWTHSTAGSADMLETESFITGLGRVGPNLLVYKRDSVIIAGRTGIDTAPIKFPTEKKNVGLVAPMSLVNFRGKNAFLSRDDFYVFAGGAFTPIGAEIRDEFFEIVGATEIEKVVGAHFPLRTEIEWIATTSSGKYSFVFNYHDKSWSVNEFYHDMISGGKGAV